MSIPSTALAEARSSFPEGSSWEEFKRTDLSNIFTTAATDLSALGKWLQQNEELRAWREQRVEQVLLKAIKDQAESTAVRTNQMIAAIVPSNAMQVVVHEHAKGLIAPLSERLDKLETFQEILTVPPTTGDLSSLYTKLEDAYSRLLKENEELKARVQALENKMKKAGLPAESEEK